MIVELAIIVGPLSGLFLAPTITITFGIVNLVFDKI